jgi:hypothetical protein
MERPDKILLGVSITPAVVVGSGGTPPDPTAALKDTDKVV